MVMEVPTRPASRRGSWLDRFIPRPLRAEPGTLYRSRLFVSLWFVVVCLASGSALGFSFLSPKALGSYNLPVFVGSLLLYTATSYAFYFSYSLRLAVHGLMMSVMFAVFGVALILVLKYQLLTFMLLPVPVIAFILGGRWSGVFWTLMMVALQILLIYLFSNGYGASFDFGVINPVIGRNADLAVNVMVIGLVIASCITYEIIVARLQAELELEKSHFVHLANHDPLTELPNRLAFESYTRNLMAQSDKLGQRFTLIYMDVDNFKQVNDSFGHLAGDELLKEVASRLRQAVRDEDYVARLSGDEFAMVIPGLGKDALASRRIEKLRRHLQQDIAVGEGNYRPSASFGKVVYPRDAQTYEELLGAADLAMYSYKGRSKVPPAAQGCA